jgi:hypothetical protein
MRPTTEHYLKKDLAKRAGREVPRSGGVAPPGGPSPSSPDDPRPRIGARVRIEGVVMGRQKYGVNVRLPDGTIQGFSNVAVSPAEPESPGDPAAQLLSAEPDAISSGEVWDEAGVLPPSAA